MFHKTPIRLIGLMLVAFSSVRAETSSSFMVTRDEVIRAMTKKQLPVDGVDITMPSRMRSTVTGPVLEIQQITSLDTQRSQLRVACQVRSECMPFYAIARWTGTRSAGQTTTGKQEDGIQVTGASDALRAGAHATLVIDDERVHIRVPVICASGGAPGDKIKVTTINHHQTFEAVILNADELKGSF